MKKVKTSLREALKEHLLLGNPVTVLDAVTLFGVPNLTALITDLRREGIFIKTRRVPYIKAVVRVNQYAKLESPKNLPTKEIALTEYWVSQ